MTTKKLNSILETTVWVMAGGVIALLFVLIVLDIKQLRATASKVDSLETRITNLEQDLKNTKEVLDSKGIEDLNL